MSIVQSCLLYLVQAIQSSKREYVERACKYFPRTCFRLSIHYCRFFFVTLAQPLGYFLKQAGQAQQKAHHLEFYLAVQIDQFTTSKACNQYRICINDIRKNWNFLDQKKKLSRPSHLCKLLSTHSMYWTNPPSSSFSGSSAADTSRNSCT